MRTRYFVKLILLGAALTTTACSGIRNEIYGQRGVDKVTKNDQFGTAHNVDLAFLLDPTNQRALHPANYALAGQKGQPTALEVALPGEAKKETRAPVQHDKSEIDRAAYYFRHPSNNQGGSPPPGVCSKTGRDAQTVDNFVTIMETVTTVESFRRDLNGAGKPTGAPRDRRVLNKTAKQEVTEGPKTNPIMLCAEEQMMKQRRNAIIEQLIANSKAKCEKYKFALTQFDGDVTFASALAAIGLGAAGGLVEGASQILSTAAGAVSGFNIALSESYFQGGTVRAVIAAIDTKRAELLTEIRKNQAMSEDEYKIDRALGDVSDYHNACSLVVGVGEVNRTVEEKLERVTKALKATPEQAPEGT